MIGICLNMTNLDLFLSFLYILYKFGEIQFSDSGV